MPRLALLPDMYVASISCDWSYYTSIILLNCILRRYTLRFKDRGYQKSIIEQPRVSKSKWTSIGNSASAVIVNVMLLSRCLILPEEVISSIPEILCQVHVKHPIFITGCLFFTNTGQILLTQSQGLKERFQLSDLF